jgi:hypothetical protein
MPFPLFEVPGDRLVEPDFYLNLVIAPVDTEVAARQFMEIKTGWNFEGVLRASSR